jgi:threonine dehydrogenase-like Zn-dependent dehydrogenase
LGGTLVEVAAAGICGSDLHYFKDGGIGAAVVAKPFVPGHEFGGYLCEDVPECGLSRGAMVAVDPTFELRALWDATAPSAAPRRGGCDGIRSHLDPGQRRFPARWY